MGLDVRGHIDRVADRVPPLRYLLRVQDRYQALHGSVSANSITLTAFLALFAITLLAVAVIGYLPTDIDIAQSITDALGLRGDAADVVTNAVDTARRSARFASLVGLLGVITIGTSFAGAIATAYNIAWGVKNRGLVERLRGLVWLAGFGLLGFGAIMATTLWTRMPSRLSPLVIVMTFIANAILWAFTSWWLPNRRITWRAMLPGVIAGAVMLEALKVGGGILVPRLVANASELWGTIGAVFALIAWLLFFGRVVVYVTVIEATHAERIGVKRPHPDLLP